MTLSDIKFEYQEKINKINKRIDKYSDIIMDYTKTIEKAGKEETPNISSVLKSKTDYERKIKNMQNVKSYYQQFVDTADYLMQDINNEQSLQLLQQNEHLTKKIEFLQNKNDELEYDLKTKNTVLCRKNTSIESKKIKIKELKAKHSDMILDYQKKIKNLNEELIKLNNVKKENKSLKKENKKIYASNEKLYDKLNVIERKNENLEQYCTSLLNKTCYKLQEGTCNIYNNNYQTIGDV